ncbi:MAG TPA: hypothetical protein VF170_15730 [Planctomycetaceae bacterium]
MSRDDRRTLVGLDAGRTAPSMAALGSLTAAQREAAACFVETARRSLDLGLNDGESLTSDDLDCVLGIVADGLRLLGAPATAPPPAAESLPVVPLGEPVGQSGITPFIPALLRGPAGRPRP